MVLFFCLMPPPSPFSASVKFRFWGGKYINKCRFAVFLCFFEICCPPPSLFPASVKVPLRWNKYKKCVCYGFFMIFVPSPIPILGVSQSSLLEEKYIENFFLSVFYDFYEKHGKIVLK